MLRWKNALREPIITIRKTSQPFFRGQSFVVVVDEKGRDSLKKKQNMGLQRIYRDLSTAFDSTRQQSYSPSMYVISPPVCTS